jgi:hypothetical protein
VLSKPAREIAAVFTITDLELKSLVFEFPYVLKGDTSRSVGAECWRLKQHLVGLFVKVVDSCQYSILEQTGLDANVCHCSAFPSDIRIGNTTLCCTYRWQITKRIPVTRRNKGEVLKTVDVLISQLTPSTRKLQA